jgi:hypothetical protein
MSEFSLDKLNEMIGLVDKIREPKFDQLAMNDKTWTRLKSFSTLAPCPENSITSLFGLKIIEDNSLPYGVVKELKNGKTVGSFLVFQPELIGEEIMNNELRVEITKNGWIVNYKRNGFWETGVFVKEELLFDFLKDYLANK